MWVYLFYKLECCLVVYDVLVLPRLFLTVFPHLNYEALRPVSWCIFFSLFSCKIIFCGLISSRPLFRHIFNIAVPVWGHMHHLARVLKPWKSELCLWITIHKNIFPLHPPQVALITDESLLSVVLTLLAMFLVCWGAWPILSFGHFFCQNEFYTQSSGTQVHM